MPLAVSTYEEERNLALNVHDVVSEENTDLESELREVSLDVMDQIKMANRDSQASVIHTTHLGDTKRRTGILSDLERDFVKDYGKRCLVKGKNIDNNCMLKEYKNIFSGYTRDGEILKKCWINWKKDSPAYKEFINSLKK